MRMNLAIGALACLGLAACGETGGHLVSANSMLMTYVEPPSRKGDVAEAVVHYVMARPEPLASDHARRVVRMRYESVFDCAAGTVANRKLALELEDGEIVTRSVADPEPRRPAPDTISAKAYRGVCDPAFAERSRTLKSLEEAERDYRKRLADRKS